MKYNGVGLHRILKLNILRDVVSKLTRKCTFVWYPESLHLIGAIVDVDGKLKRMTFITDNFIGAAHFICNLYKVRRAIAVLLKEIKQTLQVIDFIGCNENAVCRQIWTNLPTYILHRFIEWQKEWKHTCAGWFSVLCGVIWRRLYMGSFFPRCGTASDPDRIRGVPGFASV